MYVVPGGLIASGSRQELTSYQQEVGGREIQVVMTGVV